MKENTSCVPEIYFMYKCKNITSMILILPFCQKKETKSPEKILSKGDFSGMTEKDDIHPRKLTF